MDRPRGGLRERDWCPYSGLSHFYGAFLLGFLWPIILLYLFESILEVVLMVKNLPTSAGEKRDWVRSLDLEDSLEEGMATHSSILA